MSKGQLLQPGVWSDTVLMAVKASGVEEEMQRTLEVVWGRKMFGKYSIYNVMGKDLSKRLLHTLKVKVQKVYG